MTESLIQDVSDTAFMVATYRAMESERPDALFRDPLAARLAGEHGPRIVTNLPQGRILGKWFVAIRTHIIDGFITNAVASGVDTIINLGAGLDTRPYRMNLPPSLRWIEVDYPKIIALKESRLAQETPHCRLERVQLDLTDSAARRDFLARIGQEAEKVLVLTEGVILYLSLEDAASLADDLRAQRNFQYWIIDYLSPHAMRWRKRQHGKLGMENAPFLFAPPDWFGFFHQHGWRESDIRYLSEEAERLKRPPSCRFALRSGSRSPSFLRDGVCGQPSGNQRPMRSWSGAMPQARCLLPAGPKTALLSGSIGAGSKDTSQPRDLKAMATLFEAAGLEKSAPRPLADRLRPKTLDDVMGQEHLLGEGGVLRRMLASKGGLRSVIFWGPPGTGKTTVARLVAEAAGHHFEQLSAIYSGVQELRKVFEAARERRRMGLGTVLFVDEIHRFNRAQQDSFLPVMEDGTIILIGATTENPSFELNGALLSRATVLVFRRLEEDALEAMLARAEEEEGRPLPVTPEARHHLLGMADGDGRALLNLVEAVYGATATDAAPLTPEELVEIVQRRAPLYDKNRDGHYDLISALHKSVRGSDPDAALYWLARMLDGGEDPLYVARRLVRMAVEDIGLADPQALVQANAAKEAYDFLGSPEGELALAQATIYLATAPKSNAGYVAFGAATRIAKESGSLAPPKIILNAPTKLMAKEGYGRGYVYDPDTPQGFSGQDYFPEELGRQRFYRPTRFGQELEIGKRLASWEKLRKEKND